MTTRIWETIKVGYLDQMGNMVIPPPLILTMARTS